jgi:hypothetical protein
VSFPTVVFKTTALVHSAIPPQTEVDLSLRGWILPWRARAVKADFKQRLPRSESPVYK